jgi:tRNA (guanine37-N1)-methyltransferase
MLRIGVVTLFPEMIAAVREFGVTGRALERGLASLTCWNPREFTRDRQRTVDDRPYGGGPGMVMLVEPLRAAIEAARADLPGAKVYGLSPQGEPVTQARIAELVAEQCFVLVAGRYEGIDERVMERDIDAELSLGDFVLSGGEIAAMAVIDASVRTLPGALGDDESAGNDSFMRGLLDYPHFTRPELIEGQRVPEVLLSGDHAAIARWRRKQALGRTWQRRPDLLEAAALDEQDEALLQEFIDEIGKTT